jgi:hypothetical protein
MMGNCTAADCQNEYKKHRWGKMQAVDDGWFIQRNGQAWCPEHIPLWVIQWRIRKIKTSVPKSSPFPCPVCGWGGTRMCVIGKLGSAIWMRQIPLHRWHTSRTLQLKKLNAESKEK